jgi:hypothetical protein
MKYIKLANKAIPISDELIFEIKFEPNGNKNLMATYTSDAEKRFLIADLTNFTDSDIGKCIEHGLKGKIQDINF